MTEQNRTPREATTRTQGERKKAWNRPELLPTPKAQDGWAYHWVRVATNGDVDAMNVSSKLREGWEPCKAKDHPEIFLATVENQRFKDNIVIGGLMLCKAPTELVQERSEFFRDQNTAQMQSVDNNLMRENDPRMPLFNERQSKVSFGKG